MQLNYHAVGGLIDRRDHTRAGVDLYSLFFCNNRLATGRISDMSLSGLQLQSETEVPVGRELEMLLKLDFVSGSRHLRIKGTIVREIPDAAGSRRYGVVFTAFTAADRLLVDAWLTDRLAKTGTTSCVYTIGAVS